MAKKATNKKAAPKVTPKAEPTKRIPLWDRVGAKTEGEKRVDPTPTSSRSGGTSPTSKTTGLLSSGLGDELQREMDNDFVGPHVEVRALAGTGKTTTVISGVMKVKGVDPGIKPSDQQAEVWKQLSIGKSDTIRLSAFNSSITDELKERVAACGLDRRGVEARGVHSLGLQAVTKAFGRLSASDWADRDQVAEVLGGNWKDLLRMRGMADLMQTSAKLVSLCKQTMSEPSPDNLEDLIGHYDLDFDGDFGRLCETVEGTLERCLNPKGRISFDDMIWLPLVKGLSVPKVDIQIIDEAQDLNRMQQELVYLAGRRIIFVGDPHQAIYGFAGADSESMPRMKQYLEGCVTLPLTVTRRCGKSIVEEARQIVPEFEAHESNPLGEVRTAKYPTQPGGIELPWDKSYLAGVRGGDRLICRVNAPLVSQCFRLLKAGIPATILGRDIGQGLISLIEKSKADTVGMLRGWLDEWLDMETAKEQAKKRPSEDRVINLQDRHACLACFCEGAETVNVVKQKIEDLFTDRKDRIGVQLSTIHKAKGLEADRVFFLQPERAKCPHPMAKTAWQQEQEWNLRYVAITRAKKELIHVS